MTMLTSEQLTELGFRHDGHGKAVRIEKAEGLGST